MKITLKEELNRIKKIMGVKILSEQDLPRAVTSFSDDAIINAIKEYIPKIASLAGGTSQGSYNKNLALNLLRDISASSGKNINSFGKPNVNFSKYSTDKFGNKKIQSDTAFNPKAIDTGKLLSGFENLNAVQKADIVKKYTTEMIQLGIISPEIAVDAMIAHNDTDYKWVRWWMSDGQYQVMIKGDVAKVDNAYLDMSINEFMAALKIPQSMRYTMAERVKSYLMRDGIQINPKYTAKEKTSLLGKETQINNMVPGGYTEEQVAEAISQQVMDNFVTRNNNPTTLYNYFVTSNDLRFTELKKWLVIPKNKELFIKAMSQNPTEKQWDEAFNTLKREGLLSQEQMTWVERHRKFCYKTVKGFKGDKDFIIGSEVGKGDEYTLEKMTRLCRVFQTYIFTKIFVGVIGLVGSVGLGWIFRNFFFGNEAISLYGWFTGCVSKEDSDKFLNGDDEIFNEVNWTKIGISREDFKNEYLPMIKAQSLYNFKKFKACDEDMLYMLIPQKTADGSLDLNLSKRVFLTTDLSSNFVLKNVDSEQGLMDNLKGDYDTFINRAKGAIEDAKKQVQNLGGNSNDATGPIKDTTNSLSPIVSATDSTNIVDN
jgi:hypothetical protein